MQILDTKKFTNIKISKILITIFVGAFALTMLFPLLWMISASLKYEADVFTYPIQWLPERWHAIENYKEVWSGQYNFALFYWNTIKITVIATTFQVLVSAMGAYAFAKIDFKFKNAIFAMYIATLMIPDQVTLVPKFMMLRWMQLFDTHTGLILLLVFSVYGIFLLRQNMVAIPDALCNSAKIDGAGHFRIFWQIILPITKPGIATLAILKFVWTWNDYQNPLVFLNTRELFTIQIAMKQFASVSGTYYALIMAASVSAIIPLLIVFLLGQKYVVDGIVSGAVKG